jgi:hypothetical protein
LRDAHGLERPLASGARDGVCQGRTIERDSSETFISPVEKQGPKSEGEHPEKTLGTLKKGAEGGTVSPIDSE